MPTPDAPSSLLPFATHTCAMCGLTPVTAEQIPIFKFCRTGHAESALHGHYQEFTGIGQPHLHQICRRCGFAWLTETVPAGHEEPSRLPADVGQALALAKSIGAELQKAAEALLDAAEWLRGVPLPREASATHKAYLHAKAEAEKASHL